MEILLIVTNSLMNSRTKCLTLYLGIFLNFNCCSPDRVILTLKSTCINVRVLHVLHDNSQVITAPSDKVADSRHLELELF